MIKRIRLPVLALAGLLGGKGELNIPEMAPDSWIRQFFNTKGWAEVPHGALTCPTPGGTTLTSPVSHQGFFEM